LLWMAPGLIVPLLVVAVPALVRTMAASNRAATVGDPMAAGAKIGAFFTSVLLVVLVLIAGFVAFCMACFAVIAFDSQLGGKSVESLIRNIFIGGGLVALPIMIWIFIATWPKAK